MTPHLPHAVEALVTLAAQHPEGAAPLFEGDLESVACLYQVHAAQVERARWALTTPAARQRADELVAQAARSPRRSAARRAPRDVATLIAEAALVPDGVALLTDAPVELAAVRLGAHPFLVDEARAWLASRRPAPTPPAFTTVPLRPPRFEGDRAS